MKNKTIITFVILLSIFLFGCSSNVQQPVEKTKDPAQIVSVIMLDNSSTGYKTGQGSGFFLRYKNRHFFVTASHVVDDVNGLCVFDRSGNVIKIDNYYPIHLGESDISIFPLKKLPKNVTVYTLRKTPLQKGETLIAYGYTRVDKKQCLLGLKGLYLNDYMMISSGYRFLGTTCPIKFGMSGGPVVDENGKLVGIVSSTLINLPISRSYAASAETIRKQLDFFN